MPDMENNTDNEQPSLETLETVRLALDQRRLDAENKFREKQLDIQMRELELKLSQAKRGLWRNPIFVSVFIAVVGVVSSVGGVMQQGQNAPIRESSFSNLPWVEPVNHFGGRCASGESMLSLGFRRGGTSLAVPEGVSRRPASASSKR